MRKKISFIVLSVAVVVAVAFWYYEKNKGVSVFQTEPGKKLSVVATFYPLEEFARAAGGEDITVKSIVPAGAEPHDYEPAPQDILSAYRADIFLINGGGVDIWAEKIRPDLEKHGVTVVQMSEKIPLLPNVSGDDQEGVSDPHFWLDPVLAEKEVEAIRDVLIARDSAHQEKYTQSADRYLASLVALDTSYREGLSQCRLRTIVTTHAAFGYLAREYDLKVVALSGISPESEPSPRTLADVAMAIRKEGIKYIFFETLVSPKVAETLAQETGASTLVFDPLEGMSEADRRTGKTYLSIMGENLSNLQTALQCQR